MVPSWLQLLLDGWRIIIREIARIFAGLTACLRAWLAKRERDQPRPRKFENACCTDVPWDVRARPDPFIYSQQWLASRGLAVTWDNPDFRLVDVATGLPVDRFSLVAGQTYRIEATIHNNSFMAAIGTNVLFEVLRFGAGTGVIDNLGAVTIDVPGAGSTIAAVNWKTPATGGHNCLKVTIAHMDDANPFNNVGQHNTDIARPAGSSRMLPFHVGNHGISGKQYTLAMDAYRLPERPLSSESHRDRGSLTHLRRLQRANDVRSFPVPESFGAKLSRTQIELTPGQEVEIEIELTPPPASSELHAVNVNVFEGEHLVGGVTAYVKGA